MDKYKFGEFIYQKRKSLGLTQEELGRKLGVTNKAVSKWEVGETTPDIMMLEPLASILQITVDELLKQKTNNDKNKEIVKTNKIFLIFTIILAALNIFIVCLFIGINIYMKNKKEVVEINNLNYREIIQVDPLTHFISDGQNVTISSTYQLNDKYDINKEKEIQFIITYEINYYYLDTNDNLCVISYYERTKEVIFNKDVKFDKYEITLSPKTTIENFKSFKEIDVKYNIDNYSGEVYKVK